jgi:transcription antitermination factor NusG
MNTQSHWYAVYTKPKWEKKVAELLTRKGIENYCPLNKILKQWHDRKKWVDEPLFTSYVFICVTPKDFVEVKKTDGIINLVYWLGKPAVIKDDEITAIRNLLGSYKQVQLEKTKIKPEDSVQIVSGPLKSREGKVLEVYSKTVKVLLPSLGYALVAQLEKSSLEVINGKGIKPNAELSAVTINQFKIA